MTILQRNVKLFNFAFWLDINFDHSNDEVAHMTAIARNKRTCLVNIFSTYVVTAELENATAGILEYQCLV